MILSLLAISFDLCWGFSGIMTFGQALFFGVAGYVIALVGRDLDFSAVWGTLPLAMLTGLRAGVRVRGLPAARAQAADHDLRGARHAHRLLCRGAAGLGLAVCRGRQRPVVGQAAATRHYEFVEGLAFYSLALVVLVLVYPACRYLMRSQLGLVLAGMRQNEERLAFFGYRVQVFKALVFSLRRHDRRAWAARSTATTRASSGPATWGRACRRRR